MEKTHAEVDEIFFFLFDGEELVAVSENGLRLDLSVAGFVEGLGGIVKVGTLTGEAGMNVL